VVFTDPGGVPQGWRPSSSSSEDDLEMQSSPLVDQTAEMMTVAASLEITPQSANVRYCKKCCQFKPPRCHHCSVCGRCILKMDHHCIWVVNCVGAHNYKFFLLFLVSTGHYPRPWCNVQVWNVDACKNLDCIQGCIDVQCTREFENPNLFWVYFLRIFKAKCCSNTN
jgi:hypothetical protein